MRAGSFRGQVWQYLPEPGSCAGRCRPWDGVGIGIQAGWGVLETIAPATAGRSLGHGAPGADQAPASRFGPSEPGPATPARWADMASDR